MGLISSLTKATARYLPRAKTLSNVPVFRPPTAPVLQAAPARTWTKVAAGLGLGALGFEAINPGGNNPLIPDVLENPLEATSDAASTVAKLVPWLIGAAATVAAVVLVRNSGSAGSKTAKAGR